MWGREGYSLTHSFPGKLNLTPGFLPPPPPVAPPSYAEIVTDEQRQSSLDVAPAREELDGPLFAYIHEFRFQPPPLYSEVGRPSSLRHLHRHRRQPCWAILLQLLIVSIY